MEDPARPYHHGDLRAALLAAAEAELTERGIEAFSLRAVAKRAGVSHAAPAHHFGDVDGLLTALAAQSFQLFLAAQLAREAKAAPDASSQIVAAAQGYVDFAMGHPALFRLQFGSQRPNYASPDLTHAAEAAYLHLVDLVHRAGGESPKDEAAVWATSHGLADLMSAGRLNKMDSLTEENRDAMIEAIIRRVVPKP